jgi:hypothetical protein
MKFTPTSPNGPFTPDTDGPVPVTPTPDDSSANNPPPRLNYSPGDYTPSGPPAPAPAEPSPTDAGTGDASCAAQASSAIGATPTNTPVAGAGGDTPSANVPPSNTSGNPTQTPQPNATNSSGYPTDPNGYSEVTPIKLGHIDLSPYTGQPATNAYMGTTTSQATAEYETPVTMPQTPVTTPQTPAPATAATTTANQSAPAATTSANPSASALTEAAPVPGPPVPASSSGFDVFLFGAASFEPPVPIKGAVEGVGLLGYSSSSGAYLGVIGAGGVLLGGRENYAGYLVGREITTASQGWTDIQLNEASLGMEVPLIGGIGIEVGTFTTATESGLFGDVHADIIGGAAVGGGFALPQFITAWTSSLYGDFNAWVSDIVKGISDTYDASP